MSRAPRLTGNQLISALTRVGFGLIVTMFAVATLHLFGVGR